MPAAPISAPAALNPQRVLSYLVRLPLFTRAVDIIIVAFWVLGLQGFWDVKAWGGLVPDKLSFTTGERVSD